MRRKLMTNLQSSSKQQVDGETVQQVGDDTVIGEKKAQQAIYHSLMGSSAAMILFVSLGNVMNWS